jgi:hypothetical protein
MNNEIWKPLRGYDGYLEISNFGNVKLLKRIVSNGTSFRTINEKIIPAKASKDKYGYAIIQFTLNNKKHALVVGRAVYESFNNIELDVKKVIVNKDGNRLNNKLDNLKIITRRSIKQIRANKTGRVGVSKHDGFYSASIVFEGRRLTLHTSTKKEECHKIYQLAKSMIDEYDKLKAGILSKSRLNNKLIEQKVLFSS